VANSASYNQRAIAQGSLFVIFGSGMGPDTLVHASSFPLPTNLSGTSVRIVSGGTSLDCPLVYTSSSQVAAILPSKTPVGQASVFVTYNGQSTSAPDIFYGPFANVVPSSVGIYAVNSQGAGPGIFSAPDGSVTDFVKTAKAGDVLTLWATGIGPIAGDDALPPEARNVPGVEVFVGAQAARVLYAGRSPCCAALDQISFEVPQAGDSCFMPVLVRSGGVVSNVVTLSVNSQSSPCADAGPAIPSSIYTRVLNGENLKVATLAIGPVGLMAHIGFNRAHYLAARLSAALHTPVSERDAAALLRALEARKPGGVRRAMWKYRKQWNALDPKVKAWLREQANLTQEGASAAFGTLSVSSLIAIFVGVSPPVGACLIFGQNLPDFLLPARSRALDAGPSLMLHGPGSQVAMTSVQRGQYQGLFGASVLGPNVPPGAYTIVGKGGKDVGPFTATLHIGANIAWTNKLSMPFLDQSQPLTVTWTGGTVPGHVLIGGYQSGGFQVGDRAFFCAEDANRGTFTVPTVFLSVLQLSSDPVTLFIGQHPLERQIAIPGVDLAWFIDGSSDSITVPLK
jgi:uncharacterized protein (TIGR03437 family)